MLLMSFAKASKAAFFCVWLSAWVFQVTRGFVPHLIYADVAFVGWNVVTALTFNGSAMRSC